MGHYDVMVGVNLLREGLDLPEVSLIAILDADKEGFLRNTTTLIQTMGRAARHVNGHVIMYADKRTRSIDTAISETMRRRKKQEAHNLKHGITPTTIVKDMGSFDLPVAARPAVQRYGNGTNGKDDIIFFGNGSTGLTTSAGKQRAVKELTKLMEKAMKKFEYEKALVYKEQLRKLKNTIA